MLVIGGAPLFLETVAKGTAGLTQHQSRLAVSTSFLHLCGMITAVESTALGRMLRPMSKLMSQELARELVALKVEDDTQERYDYLAAGRREGSLTPDEEAELQDLVQVNSMLSMLKAEARLLLANAA